MASLPQGWHGISAIPRKSNTQSTLSKTLPLVQPFLRKKPISQLKSMPLASNGTVARTDIGNNLMKASNKVPAHSTLPIRITRTKEENAELTNLKKELSRTKDENMILRCRLRKIDDDNGKKMREIERLRLAVKDLSEKKKESQKNNFLSNARIPLRSKQNESIKTTQNNNTKSSWKENTLHSEIRRLKDIVAKLQEGNKKLEAQLKERDQEVKSLKHQLAKAPGRNVSNKLLNKPKETSLVKTKPVTSTIHGKITKVSNKNGMDTNNSTKIISNKLKDSNRESVILANSVQKRDTTGKEI